MDLTVEKVSCPLCTAEFPVVMVDNKVPVHRRPGSEVLCDGGGKEAVKIYRVESPRKSLEELMASY